MAYGIKTEDVTLDIEDEVSNLDFQARLQDLMLTFTTILIIQNRKEEALYWLDRCILICEKYKYLQTRSILTLMVASIFLSDKSKVYSDVWEKAHEALNMFTNQADKEGKAETNLMLAMIIRKKPQRLCKADSLRLKKQPRSDNIFETGSERQPKMVKNSSSLKKLKEDERNYLNVAMQYFIELRHQYGISRVALALSTRDFETDMQNKQ